MCNFIFNSLPIFLILYGISTFSLHMISRMSILEIKNKLTKEDFISLFPKSEYCFPNNEFKVMNMNTQFKLYKILFLNSHNIQEVVGSQQRKFKLFSIFAIITFTLFVCFGSSLIILC